jgi:ketosteroid isomerase-like protein
MGKREAMLSSPSNASGTRAMARENVEIVRRMLIEFNASHQLTEAWAPDLVWEIGYPGAPTTEYHGRKGFYEFLEDWFSPYEEWEQELDDVFDAGSQVVAVLHQRARLSDTEKRVELRYSVLYTLDGGLIRRARVYRSADDAVEAARLSE